VNEFQLPKKWNSSEKEFIPFYSRKRSPVTFFHEILKKFLPFLRFIQKPRH